MSTNIWWTYKTEVKFRRSKLIHRVAAPLEPTEQTQRAYSLNENPVNQDQGKSGVQILRNEPLLHVDSRTTTLILLLHFKGDTPS